MRPHRAVPLALAVAALWLSTGDAEARYNGNLNLFVGQKWLTSSQWSPVAEQPELGLMLAFGEERISFHFAVDAYYAKEEVANPNPAVDTRVKGTSGELSIGVRKLWDLGATRPYLGGGASIVTVREDLDGPSGHVTHDDRGYGAFIQVGVFWRLAGHLNLGIDARYCKADVDLGGPYSVRDVDAGGFHAGVLIGYGW
jgi:hypothetical protein